MRRLEGRNPWDAAAFHWLTLLWLSLALPVLDSTLFFWGGGSGRPDIGVVQPSPKNYGVADRQRATMKLAPMCRSKFWKLLSVSRGHQNPIKKCISKYAQSILTGD